jgi:FkbM family methyltransferase
MAVLEWLGAGYKADARFSAVHPRYRAYWDRDSEAYVTADLGEYGGRYAYYWGRYGDACHREALRQLLDPGDTYIDVGANIGMHSLFASRLVGPAGMVLAFEPHPESFQQLSAHIAMNRIHWCEPLNVALSDCSAATILRQAEEHSGTATLREGVSGRTFTINTRVGDDVLAEREFPGKSILKVDVEGYEFHVLRGLRRTLERVHAAWVEVTPEWLSAMGERAEDLYRYMAGLGFAACLPRLKWKLKLFSPRLNLDPIASPPSNQHDVLFVRRPSITVQEAP